MATCLLPFFIASSPVSSPTIRMRPRKGHGDKLDGRRGEEEQECIYAYVEAVNYLLKSYAMDDVIAKAAAETETVEQHSGKTAVSFAKARKEKALRCGDAFLGQRTKSIYVKGLPLNVRSNMPM